MPMDTMHGIKIRWITYLVSFSVSSLISFSYWNSAALWLLILWNGNFCKEWRKRRKKRLGKCYYIPLGTSLKSGFAENNAQINEWTWNGRGNIMHLPVWMRFHDAPINIARRVNVDAIICVWCHLCCERTERHRLTRMANVHEVIRSCAFEHPQSYTSLNRWLRCFRLLNRLFS